MPSPEILERSTSSSDGVPFARVDFKREPIDDCADRSKLFDVETSPDGRPYRDPTSSTSDNVPLSFASSTEDGYDYGDLLTVKEENISDVELSDVDEVPLVGMEVVNVDDFALKEEPDGDDSDPWPTSDPSEDPLLVPSTSSPSRPHPPARGFSCPVCSARFDDRPAMESHVDAHYRSSFPCPHCTKVFDSRRVLDIHSRSTHTLAGGRHRCDACHRRFATKAKVARHLTKGACRGKTGRGAYGRHHRCWTCKRTFATARQVDEHRADAHTPMRCGECDLLCANRTALRGHAATHSVSCDVCNTNFLAKGQLEAHLATCGVECKARQRARHQSTRFTCTRGELVLDDGERKVTFGGEACATGDEVATFECPQCDVACEEKSALEHHVLRAHAKATCHACPRCEDRFETRRELRDHLSTHDAAPDETFACAECNARFPLESTLARHRERPCFKQPWRCSRCGVGFKREGNLLNHVQFCQAGRLRLACDSCPATFAFARSLATHRAGHGVAKPEAVKLEAGVRGGAVDRRCVKCRLRFESEAGLNGHVSKGACARPLMPCHACDATFKYRLALQKHVVREHWKEADGPPPVVPDVEYRTVRDGEPEAGGCGVGDGAAVKSVNDVALVKSSEVFVPKKSRVDVSLVKSAVSGVTEKSGAKIVLIKPPGDVPTGVSRVGSVSGRVRVDIVPANTRVGIVPEKNTAKVAPYDCRVNVASREFLYNSVWEKSSGKIVLGKSPVSNVQEKNAVGLKSVLGDSRVIVVPEKSAINDVRKKSAWNIVLEKSRVSIVPEKNTAKSFLDTRVNVIPKKSLFNGVPEKSSGKIILGKSRIVHSVPEKSCGNTAQRNSRVSGAWVIASVIPGKSRATVVSDMSIVSIVPDKPLLNDVPEKSGGKTVGEKSRSMMVPDMSIVSIVPGKSSAAAATKSSVSRDADEVTVRANVDPAAPDSYPCRLCERRFSTARALRTHVDSHDGVPFTCGACATSSDPRRKPWLDCAACGQPFETEAQRNMHAWSHSTAFLQCDACGRAFDFDAYIEMCSAPRGTGRRQ